MRATRVPSMRRQVCRAGTRVRIGGLTAAAHLNLTRGTAITPIKPLAAGRIAVRIDGQTKSVSLSWANVLALKADNLPSALQ